MSSEKSFLHFSSLFYKRDKIMAQVMKKQNIQIQLDHYSSKDPSGKEMCKRFVSGSFQEQKDMVANEGYFLVKAICELIDFKFQDEGLMKYFLATLDGILQSSRRNIQHFKRVLEDSPPNRNLVESLLKVLYLNDKDILVYDASAKILAVLLSELEGPQWEEKQKIYLELLLSLWEKRASPSEARVTDCVTYHCLMYILKNGAVAQLFLNRRGMRILTQAFEHYSNELQTMYYVLMSLWLVSFQSDSHAHFCNPVLGIFRHINATITRISREKIIRVSFNIFRQLADNCPASIEALVDSGLLKTIDNLMKTNIKDQDIQQDLEMIGEVLERNIKILSSFEKYQKELATELLDFTPCHSEKFWKENVQRFQEQDFYLVRNIVKLLGSPDHKTVAVACNDLGEFCRLFPGGKKVLEEMGGKALIMERAQSENTLVREHALVALQKIMITNWQMV